MPWGDLHELLDKIDDSAVRDWYARAAIDQGWSRTVLANQIIEQLHRRAGPRPVELQRRRHPTLA